MAASSYHQLDSYPEGVSSNNRSSGRPRPRKFQRYKRYLRICKIASKAITVTFSAIMFACMVFMTVKYQTTKDEIRNGRTAWPTHPKLWPTFLLLAGAGLTLLLSAVTAISYCLCFDESRRSWKLTVVKYLIHILTWIIISTLYRYEKGLHGIDNDLWGWSCSQKAAVIQSEFNGVVNFESLCSIQSKSWIVSIAEFAVKIAFAVGHFVLYRKTRDGGKQKLANGVGGALTNLLEDVF